MCLRGAIRQMSPSRTIRLRSINECKCLLHIHSAIMPHADVSYPWCKAQQPHEPQRRIVNTLKALQASLKLHSSLHTLVAIPDSPAKPCFELHRALCTYQPCTKPCVCASQAIGHAVTLSRQLRRRHCPARIGLVPGLQPQVGKG